MAGKPSSSDLDNFLFSMKRASSVPENDRYEPIGTDSQTWDSTRRQLENQPQTGQMSFSTGSPSQHYQQVPHFQNRNSLPFVRPPFTTTKDEPLRHFDHQPNRQHRSGALSNQQISMNYQQGQNSYSDLESVGNNRQNPSVQFGTHQVPMDTPQAPTNRPQPLINRPQAPFNRPQAPFNRPQAPFNRSEAPFYRKQALINSPQSPFNGPQETFNGPQTPINRPQAPINSPQSHNRPQAPFNRPQAPFNRPQAPFNRSQTLINRPQAPFNRPQAPFNRPQTQLKNQQGLPDNQPLNLYRPQNTFNVRHPRNPNMRPEINYSLQESNKGTVRPLVADQINQIRKDSLNNQPVGHVSDGNIVNRQAFDPSSNTGGDMQRHQPFSSLRATAEPAHHSSSTFQQSQVPHMEIAVQPYEPTRSSRAVSGTADFSNFKPATAPSRPVSLNTGHLSSDRSTPKKSADQIWVDSWLQSLKKKGKSQPKRTVLTISNYKCCLQEAIRLKRELESLVSCVDNIKEPVEWKTYMENIKKTQSSLKNLNQILSDEATLENIKNLVLKRKLKRQWRDFWWAHSYIYMYPPSYIHRRD